MPESPARPVAGERPGGGRGGPASSGFLHTAIAAIADGGDLHPVVAYGDPATGELKVAWCDDTACAGGGETITAVDTPGDIQYLFPSIAIGSDGFPVLSYRDGAAAALKVAKCDDAACTGGGEAIALTDDPSNDVGRYSSIAIGDDGFPVISHVDATVGSLKVVRCNDLACSGGDEIVSVVDYGAASTSLAIGADGLAVVAHLSSGNLEIAKCRNTACSD